MSFPIVVNYGAVTASIEELRDTTKNGVVINRDPAWPASRLYSELDEKYLARVFSSKQFLSNGVIYDNQILDACPKGLLISPFGRTYYDSASGYFTAKFDLVPEQSTQYFLLPCDSSPEIVTLSGAPRLDGKVFVTDSAVEIHNGLVTHSQEIPKETVDALWKETRDIFQQLRVDLGTITFVKQNNDFKVMEVNTAKVQGFQEIEVFLAQEIRYSKKR